MQKECCVPAPPAVDTSVGTMDTIAGLSVYVSGSESASAAVILITDIMGYEGPLQRKLADKVAEAGYLAVVPDFLGGDFFKPPAKMFSGADFSDEFMAKISEYLPRHTIRDYSRKSGKPEPILYTMAESVGVAKQLVEEIKAKRISSIGVAGFCWGAKVAVLLGQEEIIKAIVQLHPSFLETKDYEEVNVPVSVLAAPTDGAEKAIPILPSRTKLQSYGKIFPNMKHGWTIRYDETSPAAVEAAVEAHQLMLDWFVKYL